MTDPVRLRFLKSGLQTTVQDTGRPGFQEFGVPIGGAMDKRSMKTANWLVGNPPETPVLEITLLGPTIGIEGSCQMAITGADLSPMVNGLPVSMFETLALKSGDTLSFGKPNKGCRAYLAIRGQWKIDRWLGSKSAAAYSGEEVNPESRVKKGSILEIDVAKKISKKVLPDYSRFEISNDPAIRVLPGPEFEIFSRQSIARFFGATFRLGSNSNRMGYRLDPPILALNAQASIISSGVIPGTVQIPPSGHPIVLMTDAQTTGGYPRFVNVISADLDMLGQLKPGDTLHFQLTDPESAVQALVPWELNS